MPLLPASGYLTPSAPTVEPSPVPLTPYQDIRAPVEAFGGATAQALSGFGAALGKTAEHLESTQQFYDQVVVDEQKNSYESKVNNKLYGDPSKLGDVGYMGLQGKNALEARDGVRRDIDAMLSEHRSTLKNANQLRLFDQDASRYRNATLNQVGRHYDEQYNKHAAAVADDTLKLKLHEGAVAANNNNFNQLKGSLESALVADEQALRLRGADDVTIKNHKAVIVQGFTATWAVNAIERNAPEGKQFVLDHKDELGDKYDEMLHKANAASVQYDVDRMKNGLPPVTSQPNLVRGGATQAAISTTGEAHYNFLRSAGATPNEAALLTSAADAESGFGPTKTHDGGIGYGLYGHNGARLAEMQRQFGPNPTWQQQAQFALQELRSRPEGAAVNGAKTPEELTELQFQFERPKRGPGDQADRRLNTTRQLMQNPPGSGGGAPEQPAPGAGGDAKITMIGDSLSAHPIRRGLAVGQESGKVGVYNKGDTAVSGWNPDKILSDLIPNVPDVLVKDQVVSLSTGISNATKEQIDRHLTETIPAQIAALRERGAKSIVLMGVGTDPKLSGVNDRLAQIAEQNKGVGVTFAGPQRKTGGDKIHSTDQNAEVEAVRGALATPGQAGGGPSMPVLPPNEPGDFPDAEVPGLVQKLQEGAKLLPPGAKPEVWNAYVRSVRQDANTLYNQQMHAERSKALAQAKTDEDVGSQYYERMVPGGTNRPSDAEIRTDKRLSLKMRENLIGALNAPNHPQPSTAQSEANRVEAYQRLGGEVNGKPKLTKTSDIAALMSHPDPDQRITWHQFQDLDKVLQEQNGAKRQYVQPHITQLLKDAERVLFPLKHMTGGVGLQMDPDAPMRERRYQLFVENSVQDYIAGGKDVRKLFDPGSPDKPNPEYLGNRALLDEFGKGAKQFGKGQANTVFPAEGELKDNPSIMKAYKEGRFGAFGTQEAIEAAKQYSIKAGLGMRKQVVPESGVPVR